MKLADSIAAIEAERAASMPSTFVNEFRERMSELFHESLTIIPGALELVKSVNIRYCVASNGTKRKTEESLGITGLHSDFKSSIFSAYDVGIWKPDPGLFLHVAEYYGVAPGECVVVEDSVPGIRAGIDAGMHVLALTTEAIENDNPEAVLSFNSMFAIHDYLSTNGLVSPRV
jgi:HAD superfamily hydrolase (TIGR01509 family)